jgi:hypothetical protein
VPPVLMSSNAEFAVQGGGELGQAGFVGNGKQRPLDGNQIAHVVG